MTKRDKYLFTQGADVLVGETVKRQNKRVKDAAVWMVASAMDKIKWGMACGTCMRMAAMARAASGGLGGVE